ncbi:hypothetical protein Tco_1006442 [Tanacetum coccineum]|uniref:Uncharacterized protein n=1 Tax=Tanacetum coccineum TaxID=301880 RepID=A0ABQ5FIA2_9ASTR
MAAPVISISSDVSVESVGSSFLELSLSVLIFVEVPVALEVGAAEVASPAGVPELDTHSSSEADPSESSPPPYLFHLHLLLPHPGFVDDELFLSDPGRTFLLVDFTVLIPGGPCRQDYEEVGLDLTFSSYFSGSPSDSLPDTSSIHSSGCNSSGQSHSGPSTRVASPRLVYPPVMTPRYSEAFRRWMSAPLSTPYPSMTSKSSLDHLLRGHWIHLHLLPDHLARDADPLIGDEHMEIGNANAEAVTDLGIGDGVGAHTVDGIGMGVEVAASDIREEEEEFEAEASAGGTMEIAVDPLVTGGISEPTEGDAYDLEGTLYDIAHYMSKVPLDRITEMGEPKVRALLCIEKDRVDSLRHYMALSQEEFHQICRDRDDTRRRLRKLESLVERRLGFHP